MNEGLGARLRRTWALIGSSRVAFVAWVVVVAIVVVSVAFRASAEVGPGTIQARVRPALHGHTELAVPPLGAVQASTHPAPVQLRFELREVDLLGALRPDGSPGVEGIEAEVYEDIGSALQRLALMLALAAVGAGSLAALTFPGRRSFARLAAGAVLGPAAVALLVGPSAIGFDPERFETNPELSGPLLSAPELLQQVGSLQTRFGSVESRTQVLAERIAGLYSAAVTGEIARSDGEVVLLHVSDLHLNAVGLSLAQDLARNFQVDAVVDTGDITSFGFGLEAGFVELLEGFQVPYYVVAGNHDSEAVREQLADSDAVEYLDGEVAEIQGVRVLGIPDPTVTALRSIPRETLERTYRSQYRSTRQLVRDEQPDLLLAHNPIMARPVTGDVGVIASGHLHRTTQEVVDGSIIAVVGSSGATGLGNLLIDEDQPYRFQLLRFIDGELVAIDEIELTGAEGDFTLNRRVISADEEDTDDEILVEAVDEPSLEDVDAEDLERLPGRVTTTTRATLPPRIRGDGGGADTDATGTDGAGTGGTGTGATGTGATGTGGTAEGTTTAPDG